MFAIPYEYYEKYSIRRYGFHGTSHRFVSGSYGELTRIRRGDQSLIACHLGNGSSIAADQRMAGAVDTSMGSDPSGRLHHGYPLRRHRPLGRDLS